MPVRVKLDALNERQREAVTHGDGPLLVLAGAGSGKTRVIVYRIAQLIATGIPPSAIVAVSFTNKAADEMRERVHQLIGRAPGLKVCTFHSLGLRILDAEREAFGWRARPVLYDTADQLRVLGEALRSLNLAGAGQRRQELQRLLARISRWKNASLTPEDVAKMGARGDDVDQLAALLYPRYEDALTAFAAVDFDDLIARPTRLLEADAARRERYQARWRYLLVDEYQDTNAAQLRLLKALAGVRKNLTVVGDDDQSIYGWRGAQHDNILAFDREFQGARVVILDENYRSTQAILDAANAVVQKNVARRKKRLWTRRGRGEAVRVIACPDPVEEARFIAEEIRALRDRHGYAAGDFAILFRTNAQSRPLEEALRELQLPYVVVGGMAFFDRKEVKDLLAYLRLCVSTRDEISLRRVINYPARGIGVGTLAQLDQEASARGVTLYEAVEAAARGELPGIPPRIREALAGFVELVGRYRARFQAGEMLEPAAALVEELKLREEVLKNEDVVLGHRKAENLDDLLESMQRFAQRHAAAAGDPPGAEPGAAPGEDDGEEALRSASSLERWLASITLAAADDRDKDAGADRVSLMTLHAAKGLEFKVVFLAGCEEELLPHARSLPGALGGGRGAGADLAELDHDLPAPLREASPAQMLEEERRLCYVGMTRARERLVLTHCKVRRRHRDELRRVPSRFLKEIPEDLAERIDLDAPPPMDPAEEQAFGAAALAEIWKKLG